MTRPVDPEALKAFLAHPDAARFMKAALSVPESRRAAFMEHTLGLIQEVTPKLAEGPLVGSAIGGKTTRTMLNTVLRASREPKR